MNKNTDKEAKKIAKAKWTQERELEAEHEKNKGKMRMNRDINIKQYEGPETARLENKDVNYS